ncbi:hypothetical protein CSR02_00600 [Acetobacter pomorum]|uniref:Uncharacterized protein n=1 Tax=Acetobacter pomorum TaxID=65959 RepID=A0A2G4RFY4_9PROT|nr:hypothetical protein [Acetobacter pomorum]PHY95484.1 hypothetical protein CSR02_00600 [Acetobacter pomorum]
MRQCWKTGLFLALLIGGVSGAHAAATTQIQPPPPNGYQTFFDHLSAEPLRYAAISSLNGKRLLVGLHSTTEGHVAGELMLLDGTMRPQLSADVEGTAPNLQDKQSGTCQLTVTLEEDTLHLNGPCSYEQLSGGLTRTLHPSQLWSQVNSFISPDMSVSAVWLSRNGWNAAITPAPTP